MDLLPRGLKIGVGQVRPVINGLPKLKPEAEGRATVSRALYGIAWAAVAVALTAAEARGQTVGDKIRASGRDNAVVVGYVTSVLPNGIEVNGEVAPYSEIVKLEQSLGLRRHWGKGFVVGAAIGALGGAAVGGVLGGLNALSATPTDASPQDLAILFGIAGGVVGGAGGAVIGGLVRTERWRDLSISVTPGRAWLEYRF